MVGTFAPFADEEAIRRWEKETGQRHHNSYEGPVQVNVQQTDSKSMYDMEVLNSTKVEETLPAMLRMIANIDGKHKITMVSEYMEIDLKS